VVYADALRLTAITAVVVSHLGQTTGISIMGHAFTWLGTWGVDCFFVLTGFLLSQRFLEAFLGRKRFPSSKQYFLRRFLRIYPLYFFALLISICVVTASGLAPSIGNVLAHLLLLHGLFPQYVGTINAPLWTMSVDAQFYVVLPLISLVACKFVKHLPERRRIHLAWQFLCAIVAASLIERFMVLALVHLHHIGWDQYIDRDQYTVYARNIVGMGGNFAIGAMLALVSLSAPNSNDLAKWSAASFVLGFAFLIAIGTIEYISFHHPNRVIFLVANLEDLFGGCSAGAQLYGALNGNSKWLLRILSSIFVAQGAALAYSIYLFHYIFLDYARQIYRGSLASPLASLIFLLVSLVPLIGIAVIAHQFIEKPGLRLRDGFREPAPTLP